MSINMRQKAVFSGFTQITTRIPQLYILTSSLSPQFWESSGIILQILSTTALLLHVAPACAYWAEVSIAADTKSGFLSHCLHAGVTTCQSCACPGSRTLTSAWPQAAAAACCFLEPRGICVKN